MKKILCLIMILTMTVCVVSMTSCTMQETTQGEISSTQKDESFEGRLVPIYTDKIKFNDDYRNPTVRYFYDRDTKVIYFHLVTSQSFGVQPLYNPDGTLATYNIQ